jgi:hypothetical protein
MLAHRSPAAALPTNNSASRQYTPSISMLLCLVLVANPEQVDAPFDGARDEAGTRAACACSLGEASIGPENSPLSLSEAAPRGSLSGSVPPRLWSSA